jgi:hypothetical protein
MKRRCGFLPAALETSEKAVWVKGGTAATTCPKSLVMPQSLEWIERYYAWKLSGQGDLTVVGARTADAFCVLENEMRAEGIHAGQ